MFKPNIEELKEYAKLAVEVGSNVQKGQHLEIRASVEAYEFVRECAKVAYGKGASKVTVIYEDDVRNRLDYEYIAEEELCKVANWKIERIQECVDDGYCRLVVLGEDPDLLHGIDPELIKKVTYAKKKATDKFRAYSMNNIGQWTVIAYPELKWAHKVFPDIKDDDEAMQALWDAIMKTSRVEVGKTIDNWKIHNEEIEEHSKILNDFNFKSLHFTNSKGTDLTVGLIKNHIWEGGCDITRGKFNCWFNPNIPTEEVFTMPDRYHIDGIVYSTKPLSYNGNIIPEFNLTFKDGRVIDFKASENETILKNLLDTDEGSRSLGEVALISNDSPISNSGILFYETLFDENASCHLALGDCYPTNIKNGAEMKKDELYELGGNSSMEHVDFMFGSADMHIDGLTYDGETITIFENGNFII